MPLDTGQPGAARECVLVVAPTGEDAAAAREVLAGEGIVTEVHDGDTDLSSRLESGVSTLLIAQEALTLETTQAITRALDAQPEWSDLPVIVMTAAGVRDSTGAAAVRDLLPSGNVTLLERPFRRVTLLSAVRMALRARDRQHQLAVHLAEKARAQRALEETIRSVTAQLERSNQSLRLSERMAALGTFAAGLGHDLSNLLLPLRARLGELLARPDLGPELAADLAALSGPAEYLAQLTRGLRHFARDPEHGWDDPRTDLSAWRGEFEGLARTVIPGDVSLRLVLEDPLPVAAIPAHALTQAVFNLVHNAAEAVSAPAPRGPEALIEVRLDRAPDDGWFFLRVRDNGPGMSREVRERCLEPFFTTKARQKGTGLGLAMVHGIVRRAGGSIDVDSTPGLGTTFSLRLPACPTHPAEAAGCPCPAYVTLGDPRAQSLVEICLTSLGCLVASTPPNGSPGPALWVADAAAAREDELRAFLSRGPNRRLVAVNGRPEAAAPGLTVLTPGASFGDLRRTVQEAALALRRLERERESSR